MRCLWLGLLCSISSVAVAMEQLDDDSLRQVDGGGVGVFLEDFFFDGGSAQTRLSGITDTNKSPVNIRLTDIYLQGKGSQRGVLDVPVNIGSPLHPFSLDLVTSTDRPSLPNDRVALEIAAPRYSVSDPLNDTAQYGRWAFYQRCSFGSAGCTDPDLARQRIQQEITGLSTERTSLESTYTDWQVLKSGIDSGLQAVATLKVTVDTKRTELTNSYNTMQTRWISAGSLGTLGVPITCHWFWGCSAAESSYNNSVSAYNSKSGELEDAQKAVAQEWQKTGTASRTLRQRLADYERYETLCGKIVGNLRACGSGLVTVKTSERGVIIQVRDKLNSGGTRRGGLDAGTGFEFTLPSQAYQLSNGSVVKGAITQRLDFFTLDIVGLSGDGTDIRLWGDNDGYLKSEMNVKLYADSVIIGACKTCDDSSRLFLNNVALGLSLGYGKYQPLRLSASADGNFVLELPKITWANHQDFYQNAPKSYFTVGDMRQGSNSLGPITVSGIRVNHLEIKTVDIPR